MSDEFVNFDEARQTAVDATVISDNPGPNPASPYPPPPSMPPASSEPVAPPQPTLPSAPPVSCYIVYQFLTDLGATGVLATTIPGLDTIRTHAQIEQISEVIRNNHGKERGQRVISIIILNWHKLEG